MLLTETHFSRKNVVSYMFICRLSAELFAVTRSSIIKKGKVYRYFDKFMEIASCFTTKFMADLLSNNYLGYVSFFS